MKKWLVLLAFSFVIGCFGGGFSSSPSSESSDSSFISSLTKVEDSQTGIQKSVMTTQFADDSSGNIYLATPKQAGGWVILRSTNEGDSWSLSDSAVTGSIMRIAGDSAGNVFGVGQKPAAMNDAGLVRKFNGTAWSDALAYQHETNEDTAFVGVAVDSSDDVYAVGYASITTPYSATVWIVTKSTDNGGTWNVVDEFWAGTETSGTFCLPDGIFISSADKIYVWGYCAMGGEEALIRMSSNAGVAWSNVYEDWDQGQVRSMAEWNGGILIAKEYPDTNLGVTKIFHTQDDFDHLNRIATYSSSYIAGFRVDSRGYIYLSGVNSDGAFLAGTKDGDWVMLSNRADDLTSPEGENANDMYFNGNDQILYSTVYNATAGGTGVLRVYQADLTSTSVWTPSALSNGTDLTSPIASGEKIIYLTSKLYDGALGGSAAAAISAADAACNSDSAKPTFASGTFKAMLVNSARIACTSASCATLHAAEHTDWVLAASTTYVKRDGTTWGTTTADGIFTSLATTLGNSVPYYAWTGLTNDPAQDWTLDATFNCTNWTSNNGADSAPGWNPAGADLSNTYVGATWGGCDQEIALICVEQ